MLNHKSICNKSQKRILMGVLAASQSNNPITLASRSIKTLAGATMSKLSNKKTQMLIISPCRCSAEFAWARKKKTTRWFALVNVLDQWAKSTKFASKSGWIPKGMCMMVNVSHLTFGKLWSVNCARSHLRGKWGQLCSILWILICQMDKATTMWIEGKTTWSWRVSILCLPKLCMFLICDMMSSVLVDQLILIWKLLIFPSQEHIHTSVFKATSSFVKITAQSLEPWSKFRDLSPCWHPKQTAPRNQH